MTTIPYQSQSQRATSAAPPASGQQTPRVALLKDGRRVSYAIYGDPEGKPVLALHGAPACRLMFAMADDPARRRGLKLIAPDRPGYADTPADVQPTLQSRARWLAAFADAVGLQQFVVLGISGGCPYAVALSALLGTRVSGVALVSPMGPAADYSATEEAVASPMPFLQRRFFLHLGPRTWLTQPCAALIAAIARRRPQAVLMRSMFLAGRADGVILRKPHVRAGLAQMMAEAFRSSGLGGAWDLAIYGRPWGVDFGAITAPSVIWQGTADKIVPVEATRYLARQLPQCSYNELQGAGHFWVVDNMDEVLQRVARLGAI